MACKATSHQTKLNQNPLFLYALAWTECQTCFGFHSDPSSSFGLAMETSDWAEPAAGGRAELPCLTLKWQTKEKYQRLHKLDASSGASDWLILPTVAHHLHADQSSGDIWTSASWGECRIHVGYHSTHSMGHHGSCTAPCWSMSTPGLLHGASKACRKKEDSYDII